MKPWAIYTSATYDVPLRTYQQQYKNIKGRFLPFDIAPLFVSEWVRRAGVGVCVFVCVLVCIFVMVCACVCVGIRVPLCEDLDLGVARPSLVEIGSDAMSCYWHDMAWRVNLNLVSSPRAVFLIFRFTPK